MRRHAVAMGLFVTLASSLFGCAAPTDDDAESGSAAVSGMCPATPICDGTSGPALGRPAGFDHLRSNLIAFGTPVHRGRDQIYTVGEAQWIVGTLSYSIVDKSLEDESVDIYVERGCGGTWEKLGSTRSADDKSRRPAVEGVEDDEGRVFFPIPPEKALPVGRHRVRIVVVGDNTSTDLLIDVVAKETKIVVSDVDGTLTSSEYAAFPALLAGELPAAQPHAPEVLGALAARGYHVVYLTARPEWLTGRTHQFLSAYGFPRGVVHTTTTLTGANGDAAMEFKKAELRRLVGHGLDIVWAFGNQPSDVEAYQAVNVAPADHRVFLNVPDTRGGRSIAAYAEVLGAAAAAEFACRQ